MSRQKEVCGKLFMTYNIYSYLFVLLFTAKLHALLNTNSIPAHPIKHSPAPMPMWEQTDESLSEDSRLLFYFKQM